MSHYVKEHRKYIGLARWARTTDQTFRYRHRYIARQLNMAAVIRRCIAVQRRASS